MRKLTALIAGMTLAMAALPAAAGVVITQKQHVSNGKKFALIRKQTISVQGNKQKEVDERRTLIADLDKGMIYIINPKQKSYFEMEFPPKGPMAQTMAASTAAAMNFKKAGTSREIAGYKCNDYNGGGHAMVGDFTVKECFSTSAPGAKEFSAFEKIMGGQAEERRRNRIFQRRSPGGGAARPRCNDQDGQQRFDSRDVARAGGEDQPDDEESSARRNKHGSREN